MYIKPVVEIQTILYPYSTDEHVKSMQTFIQHGSVSTYQHCINVVYASYCIATFLMKLGVSVNITRLLVGAFLHDFYLYDWHTGRFRKEGIHGFSHPIVAMQNADKYFDLDDKTLNVIESHMFPLTITHVPKSREAIMVGIADKYCAVKETLFKR